MRTYRELTVFLPAKRCLAAGRRAPCLIINESLVRAGHRRVTYATIHGDCYGGVVWAQFPGKRVGPTGIHAGRSPCENAFIFHWPPGHITSLGIVNCTDFIDDGSVEQRRGQSNTHPSIWCVPP